MVARVALWVVVLVFASEAVRVRSLLVTSALEVEVALRLVVVLAPSVVRTLVERTLVERSPDVIPSLDIISLVVLVLASLLKDVLR